MNLHTNITQSIKILTLAILFGAMAVYAGTPYSRPVGSPTSSNAVRPVFVEGTGTQIKNGRISAIALGANVDPSYTFGNNESFSSWGDAWFQGGTTTFSGKTNLLGNVDVGSGASSQISIHGGLSATGHAGMNGSGTVLNVAHGSVRISDLPTTSVVGKQLCVNPAGELGICYDLTTGPTSDVNVLQR